MSSQLDSTATHAILINVGPQGYDWLEEEDLRAAIRHELGVECQEVIAIEDRRIDPQVIHPRSWRQLARQIDRALDDLRALLRDSPGRARIVVAGRGPLPIFAYLGAQSLRITADFVVLNYCSDGPQGPSWEAIVPAATPAAADPFTIAPPPLGRQRDGRIVLSIRTSAEYSLTEQMIEPLLTAEGVELLGIYAITAQRSHREAPLGPADLQTLLGHVRQCLQWCGEACPEAAGLVVAFAGPVWIPFWVGRELNPNVLGRVDLVHYVTRGRRAYSRALALPIRAAPWFAGTAKVLFVGAEPDIHNRTRGAKVVAMIQEALERELGRGEAARYHLEHAGAATIDALTRKLDAVSPDILHLHVHGAEDRSGAVALEDASGDTVRVEAAALVKILRGCEARPALVVLSACHSAALAEAIIAEGIAEIVIFTTDEVQYKVTVDLASALYAALARGRSITAAIDQTMGTIRGRWREAAAAKIGWRVAAGINPSEVVLFPATGPR